MNCSGVTLSPKNTCTVTISVQFSTVSLAGTNSVITMLGFLSLKPTLYPGGAVTRRFSLSRSALAAETPRAAKMTMVRKLAVRIVVIV